MFHHKDCDLPLRNIFSQLYYLPATQNFSFFITPHYKKKADPLLLFSLKIYSKTSEECIFTVAILKVKERSIIAPRHHNTSRLGFHFFLNQSKEKENLVRFDYVRPNQIDVWLSRNSPTSRLHNLNAFKCNEGFDCSFPSSSRAPPSVDRSLSKLRK